MPKLLDITGQRYGRLVAISRDADPVFWRFQCDCGNATRARLTHVRGGRSKSCGCLKRELAAARFTTHGAKRGDLETRRLYGIWGSMKGRCSQPNDRGYANYGGRGINVCAAWREDFAAFLRDMGPRPTPKHSLDRIDNDGNYGPANCRWSTRSVQNNNRRTNRRVATGQTIAELAAAAGIPYHTARYRVEHGIPMVKADFRKRQEPVAVNGEVYANLEAACAAHGKRYVLVCDRMRGGHDLVTALTATRANLAKKRSRSTAALS